jgi:hypothetical protein
MWVMLVTIVVITSGALGYSSDPTSNAESAPFSSYDACHRSEIMMGREAAKKGWQMSSQCVAKVAKVANNGE